MIASRILSVAAAVLLVGALALGTLEPDPFSLRDGLASLSPGMPDAVHGFLTRNFPAWVWTSVVLPVLLRPVWLLPAASGIICAGLSLTFASREGERRRTGRRRS